MVNVALAHARPWNVFSGMLSVAQGVARLGKAFAELLWWTPERGRSADVCDLTSSLVRSIATPGRGGAQVAHGMGQVGGSSPASFAGCCQRACSLCLGRHSYERCGLC